MKVESKDVGTKIVQKYDTAFRMLFLFMVVAPAAAGEYSKF